MSSDVVGRPPSGAQLKPTRPPACPPTLELELQTSVMRQHLLEGGLPDVATVTTANHLSQSDLITLSSTGNALGSTWSDHVKTITVSASGSKQVPCLLSGKLASASARAAEPVASLLRRFGRLESLTIKDPALVPMAVQAIKGASAMHLQRLTISTGGVIGIARLDALAEALDAGELPSLTELAVEEVLMVEGSIEALASSLARSCPRLTALSIGIVPVTPPVVRQRGAKALVTALESRRAHGMSELTTFRGISGLAHYGPLLATACTPSLEVLEVRDRVSRARQQLIYSSS